MKLGAGYVVDKFFWGTDKYGELPEVPRARVPRARESLLHRFSGMVIWESLNMERLADTVGSTPGS